MRPTIMEVDLECLKNNINEIKKYVGSREVMPIIKANGYGTYINKLIDIIDCFKIVGVATVKEGVDVRKLGFRGSIFILNQPAIEELDLIVEYDLTVGLSSFEFLKEVLKRQVKIKIHLEIETGMNRTGISLNDIDMFLNNMDDNVEVEGVYTHLSSADISDDYTIKQLDKFRDAVRAIKVKISTIKYIHSLASTGILNYLSDDCNLVRPGIILYGYYPSDNVKNKLNLQPICTLKTKITFLKTVPKGSLISYSGTYITEKETIVATIPVGYADGLKRCLSNKGYVVVGNKRCKIIGNICMDSCMIDVTEIDNVKIGDDVYIWDNKLITVDEIACLCNTINYEILSTISERVERKFVK